MATEKPLGENVDRRQQLDTGTRRIDRILYCHGFASNFDPAKDKVQMLATFAPVYGVTVDYTLHPREVFATYARALQDQPTTLVIGTSMGGFFAAWLGSELGLPFIAINPALSPAISLRKHIGKGTTHFGTEFVLKREVVDAYADLPFRLDGEGEIMLDLGDEVIDAHAALTEIGSRLPVTSFEGGSHRFDHMQELLEIIRERFSAG